MRFGADLLPEEVDVMNRVSGLPVNVAAMAVVTNIWRAAQALRSTLERTVLGEYGLTWASFSTLYIVWVWGPIEVRAIARSQGVSRATVTTTVDTLERRELVRRRREGRDRRLVTVELTPEGRSCIELLYPRFNEVEALLVADLSREQQESLAHLLRAAPGEFARACASVLSDQTLAGHLANNARQLILERYDANIALQPLDRAYRQAHGAFSAAGH